MLNFNCFKLKDEDIFACLKYVTKRKFMLCKILFSCCFFLSFLMMPGSINAQSNTFIKTSDGILVYTRPTYSGNAQAVQIQVIRDNIIRVVARPEKGVSDRQSLITAYSKVPDLKWSITSDKGKVTVKTGAISAVVYSQTGAVSFFDAAGKKIINEKESSRSFTSTVFEGQHTCEQQSRKLCLLLFVRGSRCCRNQ